MPTAPKPPAFLQAARAFYADAFEHHRPKDLAAAMREWSELDAAERAFAAAHLAYLNLRAQADVLAALTELRDLLDEVADGVDLALDPIDVEPLPPEPGDEDPNPGLVDAATHHEDPNPGLVDPTTRHEDPNPGLVDPTPDDSAPDRFRVDDDLDTSPRPAAEGV